MHACRPFYFIPIFTANYWQPNKCTPLREYDPQFFQRHPSCKNASILLMGDSRIRALTGGILRKMYGNDGDIYK